MKLPNKETRIIVLERGFLCSELGIIGIGRVVLSFVERYPYSECSLLEVPLYIPPSSPSSVVSSVCGDDEGQSGGSPGGFP